MNPICRAVNLDIKAKGGISASHGRHKKNPGTPGKEDHVLLPDGYMKWRSLYQERSYGEGYGFEPEFSILTLSFMALLSIRI